MAAQPIGPQQTAGEWVNRLASLVATIRPDWHEQGVRAALAKVVDRPLVDVAAAAIAATRRVDQRTPAVIAAAGPHWPDATVAAKTYTEPGIVTRCDHGQPGMRCEECNPRKTGPGVGPTPEQRQQMRDAIAAAKKPKETR